MAGEVPEELTALPRDYYDEYQPPGPTRRFFVDRLTLGHWLRQRFHLPPHNANDRTYGRVPARIYQGEREAAVA